MYAELKQKIKIIIDRRRMLSEFCQDYKEYKKWNFNSPKVKTQCSQEAKILRQAHIIEKGLSLTNPRKGFGQAQIKELFSMLDDYLSMGFPTNGIPFRNAICVLNQYVKYQKEINFENSHLNKKLAVFQQYVGDDMTSGIAHSTLEELQKDIKGSFLDFFCSRHSMRQFSDKAVNFEDVQKAVKLAMRAPTACNRQACKVYLYSDPNVNKRLGDLIAGNNGFDKEVQNYLVITADISAFYDTFERNQLYIEAGIFTMALLQTLHFYGIASCALQNGEIHKKNLQFKKICCNIPENEKIVIFIAIGYYKKDFNYALSKRKNVEDILIKC